ncbi:MAG: hypothetical protein QM778_17210 [Myxococcales bacterium]
MRLSRSLGVLALALFTADRARASFVGLELRGCDHGWERAAIESALEVELPARAADYRFTATFACSPEVPTELQVSTREGEVVGSARAHLTDIPDEIRARTLALLWAELIPGGAGERQDSQSEAPTAPTESTQEPKTDANSAQREREKAWVTEPTVSRRRAFRRALWQRTEFSRWFEIGAGGHLVFFTLEDTLLFGGQVRFGLGPISLGGSFAQGATQTTGGEIRARMFTANAGVTVACVGKSVLQSCASLELGVGQGQLSGRGNVEHVVGKGYEAPVASGSLVISARVSAASVAFELSAVGGLAHGPSARSFGELVSSLHGPFVGLRLDAAVQP